MIPFGEYLPDQPEFANPGATVAKNVLPHNAGYKQFPSQSVYSNALSAKCQGAFAAKEPGGASVVFAGDATKLYSLSDTTFSDVSGATYTTPTDGAWEFTQFGNQVIATNLTDAPQAWTLGTSSAFADLGGTPPKARHVGVIRGFVMMGDLDESSTLTPNKVRWSALDNATDWTASATTQSDSQELFEGGAVQRIVGGDYGLIIMERAVYRATYVGSPIIFQFDLINRQVGTVAPQSVATLGRRTWWLGHDGFYESDGANVTRIGANKVDKAFFSELDETLEHTVTAAVDPINQYVIWTLPSSSLTINNSHPNKAYIYDYINERWSTAEFESETIFTSLSTSYTLEGLDALGYTMETLPFSLDSRVWSGGNLLLATFDDDHKLNYFTGSSLAAVLETGAFQPAPGRRSAITKVRPIVDGTAASTTIQMGVRDNLDDSTTWASAVSLNTTGDAPVRSNTRYHKIRANISGGFDYAQGVEATWRLAGER